MYEPLGVQDFYNPSPATRAMPQIQQGIQGIAGALQKRRQKNELADWLKKISAPQQKTMDVAGHADAPIASYNPMSDTVTPTMAQGDPVMQSLLKNLAGAPPQLQAEMVPKILEARMSGISKGNITVYEDPESGQVSRTPKKGWLPTQVSAGEALQFTGVPRSSQLKQEGKERFAGQQQLNKDWGEVRKIINPFRSSGIGGASSVFNKAAVANQAAARGLKIAKKNDLTFKELNAYVNSDVASIQRGGGVPTDVQLHESNYSTLKSKLGELYTFGTSIPATGPNTRVPDELKQRMIEIINGIIGVDNQIIDDGIGYAESAYPEAIAAHQGTWGLMKNAASKIKTVGQDQLPSIPGLGGNSDLSSMSDEQLRAIAGAK